MCAACLLHVWNGGCHHCCHHWKHTSFTTIDGIFILRSVQQFFQSVLLLHIVDGLSLKPSVNNKSRLERDISYFACNLRQETFGFSRLHCGAPLWSNKLIADHRFQYSGLVSLGWLDISFCFLQWTILMWIHSHDRFKWALKRSVQLEWL